MMARHRILAVDDDDLVLESLKSELGQHFDLITTERAHNALGILEREQVDCVISDVRMPGMDGVSFLKEVGTRFPFIGRIMITAFSDAEAIATARSERGIFKVTKPWRDELDIAVRRALELRSMRLDQDRNLQWFNRSMEFERQMRQIGDPRLLVRQALQDILGLSKVLKAELLVESGETKRTLAVAEHGKVSLLEEDIAPTDLQLNQFETSFKRTSPNWIYQSEMWVAANGVTRLDCTLSTLNRDSLYWIDFVVERLAESFERYVLVQEVKQHRRQAQQSNGHLSNMEKMASLGLLSAGVAHEINNPAAYVRANLVFMEEHFMAFANIHKKLENIVLHSGQDFLMGEWRKIRQLEQLELTREEFEAMLEETKGGVERIIDIAMNLKSFARRGITKQESVDIASCLNTSLTMMMYRYKHGIAVKRSYSAKAFALGTVAELGQVFLNLLLNAAQAMEGHGTLWTSITEEDGRVSICIRDSGPGINPEDLGRIFEPLFTTKANSEGTGLGLSITKEIVERLGGNIEVESVLGQGASFTITLPSHAEPVCQEPARPMA
jgi:signal transduction histidine kinase